MQIRDGATVLRVRQAWIDDDDVDAARFRRSDRLVQRRDFRDDFDGRNFVEQLAQAGTSEMTSIGDE